MTQTSPASWIDWIFDGLALIFFLATLYLVWINAKNIKDARAGNTVVTALLAVFCALMGNPDRFQTMKFSPLTGIETEARKTIQQAQVTLAQLQKLGSLMGQFMIEKDAALPLGSEPAKHEALKQSVLDLLKSIDLPNNELSKIAAADRKWIIASYVSDILYSGNSRVPPNKINEWAEVYGQYMRGSTDKYAELTPEKLEELFDNLGILDNHAKSMIEDYRYYLETGTQRHS
jgi:hypothetical protein